MKCRSCDVIVTQQEADEAAEIVGPGYETLCPACAESLAAPDRAIGPIDTLPVLNEIDLGDPGA